MSQSRQEPSGAGAGGGQTELADKGAIGLGEPCSVPGLQGRGSSQARCLTSSCITRKETGNLVWELWCWENLLCQWHVHKVLVGSVFKMPLLHAQIPKFCPGSRQTSTRGCCEGSTSLGARCLAGRGLRPPCPTAAGPPTLGSHGAPIRSGMSAAAASSCGPASHPLPTIPV